MSISKMCNLICFCAVFIAVLLTAHADGNNISKTTAKPVTDWNDKNPVNSSVDVAMPTAERLAQYIEPLTDFKAFKRSKHRLRIKPHKALYRPSTHRKHNPITYYNSDFPTYFNEPNFSADSFKNIKFHGADFEIPPLTYEAQSMSFKLYNQESQYKTQKFPNFDYNFDSSHASPESSFYERHPHQKYGVPPLLHDKKQFEHPQMPTIQEAIKVNTYQHFAEPPKDETDLNTDFKIIYSPKDIEVNKHQPYEKKSPQPNISHETFLTPTHQDTIYDEPQHSGHPQNVYAPPVQELPLSPHYKIPSFEFPKSSYEVPLYDPVPFTVSEKDKHESYPPTIEEINSTNLEPYQGYESIDAGIYDVQFAGHKSTAKRTSSNQQFKRRKRPGQASTLAEPTKHTLDAPELQKAFEVELTQIYNSGERASSSSYIRKNARRLNIPTTTTAAPTTIGIWNISHIVKKASTMLLPTVITPITTQTTTIVSIQKSHSLSYYGGVFSTPQDKALTEHAKLGTQQAQTANRTEKKNPFISQPRTDDIDLAISTPNSVFITTHFKSPHKNTQIKRKLNVIQRILPKNHKMTKT